MSPAWMYKAADVFLVLIVAGAWIALFLAYLEVRDSNRTEKYKRGEK